MIFKKQLLASNQEIITLAEELIQNSAESKEPLEEYNIEFDKQLLIDHDAQYDAEVIVSEKETS